MYATVGVLGGMGPAATVDLLRRMVESTPAGRDQDHVPVIVYGDPRVPDRTAAILGDGTSPLPALLAGARFLEAAAAALIVIPCNTAHVWLDDLRQAVAIPILNIVEVAIERLRAEQPTVQRVGVLSTDGTRLSGLYRRRLDALSLQTVEPDDEAMATLVSPGIAAVKGGCLLEGYTFLRRAGDDLINRGAEAVLVACTDISVVVTESEPFGSRPVIDANTSLARAAIASAASMYSWVGSDVEQSPSSPSGDGGR